MSDSSDRWTEDNSAAYREYASIVVPDRAEQIATLLTLLPVRKTDAFRIVEMASGEGYLAWSILRAFPNATLVALDGSGSMRQATARRLSGFGARAAVDAFDMATSDWYPHLDGADVAISSLCVHHLDGAQKQAMFLEIARRLTSGGAFFLADIVMPQRGEVRTLFADTWDRVTQAQSIEHTGSTDLYEDFVEDEWNYFRYPDPFDKPSPLFHQLQWLRDAGFAVADCFWMQAGHAVYGGYKTTGDLDLAPDHLTFGEALEIARQALAG